MIMYLHTWVSSCWCSFEKLWHLWEERHSAWGGGGGHLGLQHSCPCFQGSGLWCCHSLSLPAPGQNFPKQSQDDSLLPEVASLSYFVKMTRKVTNKIMRNYVQNPEHTEYNYLTVVVLITSPWNTTTMFLAQRRPSLSYTQPLLPQLLSPWSLSNHTVCSGPLTSYKVPWFLYPAGGCCLMRGWCIYIPSHHPNKNLPLQESLVSMSPASQKSKDLGHWVDKTNLVLVEQACC